VSTESANPLLDLADLVVVVRVQADPSHLGLEILRNRLGPITNLRVPLPLPRDDAAPRTSLNAAPASSASCAATDGAAPREPGAQSG